MNNCLRGVKEGELIAKNVKLFNQTDFDKTLKQRGKFFIFVIECTVF